MLQRSGFPTSIAPEIAPELNPTLTRTVARGWRRLAVPLGWLPETWLQYLVLLAVVLGLAAGLAVQVYLSVEIAHAQSRLRALQAEYAHIERRNADLVFAIASRTALERIYTEAEQQGFVPATGRAYVRRDRLTTASAAPAVGAATSSSDAAGRAEGGGVRAQVEAIGAPAAPVAASWQDQLAGAVHAAGQSFDEWRQNVGSSTRATAEQWLDRIVGW